MFFLMILLNFVFVFLLFVEVKNKTMRLCFIAFNIAFFLYSGLGIYTYGLADKYYVSYILAAATLNLFFYIGYRISNGIFSSLGSNRSKTRADSINELIDRNFTLVKVFAWIYIFIRILNLFYPEFVLPYIFATPNFDYDNLLESTRTSYSTLIGHATSTLKTVFLPFMYIYLSRCKKRYVFVYFFFDLVAQYLAGHASIGRLAIIQTILVFCLFLYIKSNTATQKRRTIILTASACLLSFMIYVFLQALRSGENMSFFAINPLEAMKSFSNSEFFYPRNYVFADQLHENGAYDASKFWLWLFTLPIPKILISIPGVDTTTSIIYRVFSYYYFGNRWYYEEGAGGMLISVLGDGILVYGPYLAFVIVIPFALFLAFYIGFLNKIKGGEILFLMTFFKFFVSFRPGVQYALANINSFISILLLLFVLKYVSLKTDTGKRGSVT